MQRALGYNRRWPGLLAGMLLLTAACEPAHRVTATKAVVRNELCAEAWLEYPDQPHPMWEEVKAADVVPEAGTALPVKYRPYRTNADTLRGFFRMAAGSGKRLAIILPVTNGCEAFQMRPSGAMSPELSARYPDMVSLQGNGTANKTADLRLDWDGSVARGQLTYNETIYFLEPVRTKAGILYLMYRKDDAGTAKQPFEATPAGSGRIEMQYDQKAVDR